MISGPTCSGLAVKSERKAARFFTLVLLLAGCGSPILCREGFPEKRPVYVTASFTDKNDLFIENLDRGEVQILEDGQPREIEFMARDELPVVYGFIFDRGMLPESIDEERYANRTISNAAAARSIAYELIDKYLGRQAIWVGSYEREFQVALDSITDGFAAKNAIQQLRGRRTSADSFLYAALFSGIQKMNERQEKRRVLFLFIQDLDTESSGKIKALKNLLAASNVELFVVAFTSQMGGRPGSLQPSLTMSTLQDMVRATSGSAYFSIHYRDHFEDVVRRMHNQIRTFYTFGFESEAKADTPGRLEISCTRPGSKVTHHPAVPAFR